MNGLTLRGGAARRLLCVFGFRFRLRRHWSRNLYGLCQLKSRRRGGKPVALSNPSTGAWRSQRPRANLQVVTFWVPFQSLEQFVPGPVSLSGGCRFVRAEVL